MDDFTGFTQQTFTFFMEIAFHNTPQTMREKRDVFNDHVLKPLQALSRAGEQVLYAVDPKMDFRPVMGGTISRIRRDTRFTHDKSPYRDYMWLDFRRKHEDFHLSFCYSISPRHSNVFMGMHSASTAARNTVRQYVLHHANQYVALHDDLAAKGYVFEGDEYKRAMSDAAHPTVYAFGQKRWFSYTLDIPLADTMDAAFAQALMEHFRVLTPMYNFLRNALD
jgi:uncharacterized protein (TIGR02453 family)